MSAGAPNPITVSSPQDMVLCVDDIKKKADEVLPLVIRDFINDGSTHQTTIAENSSAFGKYRLRSRVLVDVSDLDTSTICLGRRVKFPLGLAPSGLHGLVHADAEAATSRAAAAMNVNMGISSYANLPTEEIIRAAKTSPAAAAATDTGYADDTLPISFAQQMYTMRDKALQTRILRKAQSAGCSAVFLTGDSPVLGVRYNEWRHDFRTPEGLHWPILERTSEQIRNTTHDGGFKAFNDDSHSWARDIKWFRDQITSTTSTTTTTSSNNSGMQIWVKGVLTAEDTELAIQHGCDGIIVSNHGGRQLDGVPATLDALLECVDAAAGRIPIHFDGGVRRGSDIFIALALGAE
ncbi:hypothetical protein B0A52_01098 [Exophiala mesophila]|uniref:FMN hydroxy acid dehydrogenase domain-containing protein n=1 Tax=Exophiala mesophila TaxID=212818 RepID=A0A438NGG7_EXOME|nr:hypothetical protein B0A52_01098 [Exophiala mesophila]